MPVNLQPASQKDRVIFMDVLRGFAILGIFLANLAMFSGYRASAKLNGPFLLHSADEVMSFLHTMLIEGKFYSIFSLLFGWGIALQIKRGLSNNHNPIPLLRRRLLFMLILGAFHLLLWPGDIVFFYALLGFLLLPMRRLSDKTLLIAGSLLILLPIILYACKMKWPLLNEPASILFDTGRNVSNYLTNVKKEADFRNWDKQASWWGIIQMNIGGFFFRFGYLFFVSRIPKVLGAFMIGFALGRSGFYTHIDQHKKIIYWIIALGLLIGLPVNFIMAFYAEHHGGDYWDLKPKGLYQTIAYAIGVFPLALSYAGMLMLSYETTLGKRLLSILAPVGKMAFSNYILQTLIGSYFFFSAGLGNSGQWGPVYYTLFGLVVFICQIILSTFWLRYFNFGPFEWIWRSLTYSKVQAMIKAKSSADL